VSVISREVARNKSSDGRYCAGVAQKRTNKRRQRSKQGSRKIENDTLLAATIEKLLTGDDCKNGDWSPEIVAKYLGCVSHPTIYAWIRRSRRDLVSLLPYKGHRRATYGSVATRKYREMSLPSITLRPRDVETRSTIGHYEGDTMVVKDARIHTLVERKSRFLVADLIPVHGPGLAMQIADSTVRSMSHLPLSYRRTITYDQGSEFAWWDDMEKRLNGTKVYFAHPRSPWERGTNERMNGLLRRYFPKRKYADTLMHKDIARVVWMMNHRPRKILHWRTPCEVFGRCCTSRLN
jgi:IS30 family transposase